MKQGQFEKSYKVSWLLFERLLRDVEPGANKNADLEIEAKYRVDIEVLEKSADFSQLYRRLCHCHSLAKERKYSSYLVDYLGDLVLRGHQQLYQKKYRLWTNFIAFFSVDFPRLVRQEYKLFWLASALLYLPAVVLTLLVLAVPEAVYTVIEPAQVLEFEQMYNPDNKVLGAAREAKTNWYMFGYYINNNIGVSFRTFASGMIFGLGSLFFLVFNGLLFGGVSGHLINTGYAQSFFSFVIGHGSFELTAIVISGAAGLKMGFALVAPGNLPRMQALKNAAGIAIRLVYGVIFMLVVAAFLEAFWSSNNMLMPWQKYLVGGFLWFLVTAYLLWGGRRRGF